jgi:hypothetical protein
MQNTVNIEWPWRPICDWAGDTVLDCLSSSGGCLSSSITGLIVDSLATGGLTVITLQSCWITCIVLHKQSCTHLMDWIESHFHPPTIYLSPFNRKQRRMGKQQFLTTQMWMDEHSLWGVTQKWRNTNSTFDWQSQETSGKSPSLNRDELQHIVLWFTFFVSMTALGLGYLTSYG